MSSAKEACDCRESVFAKTSLLVSAMGHRSDELGIGSLAESPNNEGSSSNVEGPINYSVAHAGTQNERNLSSTLPGEIKKQQVRPVSVVSCRKESTYQQMDTREEASSDEVHSQASIFRERLPANYVHFTRNVETTKPWNESRHQESTCICRRPAIGAMVWCSEPQCKFQQFHCQCIGLENTPEAGWRCSDCRSSQQHLSGEKLELPSFAHSESVLKPVEHKSCGRQSATHEVLYQGAWFSILSMIDVPTGIRVVYEFDQSSEVIPVEDIATRLRTRFLERSDRISRLKRNVDGAGFSDESQAPNPSACSSFEIEDRKCMGSHWQGVAEIGDYIQLKCSDDLGSISEVAQSVKHQRQGGAALQSKEKNSDLIGGYVHDGSNNGEAPKRKNSSKFKGVSWNSVYNKWRAQLCVGSKVMSLGQFTDEIEAALKYDEAAAAHGKSVNFPRGTTSLVHNPKSTNATGDHEEALSADCNGLQSYKSRYIGVSWNKRRKKWDSKIRLQGKSSYLGSFTDEREAALSYDEAAAGLARSLNFSAEEIVAEGTSVLQKGSEELLPSSSDKKVFPASSRYAGVHWCNRNQKWASSIRSKGVMIHLGYFLVEKEAALKHDEAARELHRPVNFPLKLIDQASNSSVVQITGQFSVSKEPFDSGVDTLSSVSSRYIGVYWRKKSKKWVSAIQTNGKKVHLGCFDDEIEAALHYDMIAVRHGRPLNIPIEVSAAEEREAAIRYDKAAADLGRPVNFQQDCAPANQLMQSAKSFVSRDLIDEELDHSDENENLLSSTSSKYTGVYWCKKSNKWVCKIRISGKKFHLGSFVDETEAAIKYDIAARELGRQVNFPLDTASTDDLAEASVSTITEKPTLSNNESSMASNKLFIFPECASVYSNVNYKTTTSRFVGVYWNKKKEKWESKIRHNGRQVYLGSFDDEVDAALKYDKAAAAFKKPLNFPREAACLSVEHDVANMREVRATSLPEATDDDVFIEDESLLSSMSSNYAGVCWHKRMKKWVCGIKVNGKISHLGYFDDVVEAARVYDDAAVVAGKSLNFPRRTPACSSSSATPSSISAGPKATVLSEWPIKRVDDIHDGRADTLPSSLGFFDEKIGAASSSLDEATAVTSTKPMKVSIEAVTGNESEESNQSGPLDKGNDLLSSRSSKYIGITWHKANRKWMSQIKIQGKAFNLGYFHNEEEAARRYDIAAKEVGRPYNFPNKASTEKLLFEPEENGETDLNEAKVLISPVVGQRVDASLIHCSEGPSLAVAALRTWIQPQRLKQCVSPPGPLALVAGVKLLVSRMTEEPAGGWVALAGRSTPPHGTHAWRSSLYRAGLGSALINICQHWPNDAQLLEISLSALCCLIEVSNEEKCLSEDSDQHLLRFSEGMHKLFDLALDQFGDCSKKGWVLVLQKVFEAFSHNSCTNEPGGEQETSQEMYSRMIPALVLALKGSVASTGSLLERKILIRWCGRVVWNVVGRSQERSTDFGMQRTLFESGILDATLAVCRAFTDSDSVQYWSLQIFVSVLHSYPPARNQAAELGIGRVAAALIKRLTGKYATVPSTHIGAQILSVASQCLSYLPILERDTQAFEAALQDAEVKATDTWDIISRKCALDSRWNSLYTSEQKTAAINEFQAQLREMQRKETEIKDGFLAMLKEHRHELNHMTSWSAVRHKLSSDARFKALKSRVERVELFEVFVASLCSQPQKPPLSNASDGKKSGLDNSSHAGLRQSIDKRNSNGTAACAKRLMSPQLARVISIFAGPRSGSGSSSGRQYFQRYFRGMNPEEVTLVFLESFWRSFNVRGLCGRWNLEMTEYNLFLNTENDLDNVMQQYRGGVSLWLSCKSRPRSMPLRLEPYVWVCPCSEMNFSDSKHCFSCSEPKFNKEACEMTSSSLNQVAPGVLWKCPNCAELNVPRRIKCQNCYCGRGISRGTSDHHRQISSVKSSKRKREDESCQTLPSSKGGHQRCKRSETSSECMPTISLHRAIAVDIRSCASIDKLSTPVRGRIHQLLFRGELFPNALHSQFIKKLQNLSVDKAFALFDNFAQNCRMYKSAFHQQLMLSKFLEEQMSTKEADDPSTTPPGTPPPLSPSQAELSLPLSTSSHNTDLAPLLIPGASEVRSVKSKDNGNNSDDEDEEWNSKLVADSPWERLHYEERAAMLWASIESQRAQNKLHSKAKSPFNVLVDCSSIVESMFLASGRGMKSLSHSDGPVINLLKPLRKTFGMFHAKISSFGATAEKKSWSSEGGGRGDKTEDLGGATAEAFSCFWDEVSSFEVATRAGWTGHLLQPEGEVLATIIDDELPAPDHERSHAAVDDDDGEWEAFPSAFTLEARQATLGHFEALGRVLLWALVQRQPIPSVLATPLFLGQLLGLDLIRGPLPHQMPESELCEEVQRCYPSLAWLIRGLREEMFSDDLHASSSLPLPELSSSTAPHVSLMSLSFGAFEDDEPLTPANREEKLRAALGSLLLDQRSEVMAAIRRGFTLDGTFVAVTSSLGSLFTWPERKHLVSGEEKISAAAFIAIVEPQYPEDDEVINEELGNADGSAADKPSSGSFTSSGATLVQSQLTDENSEAWSSSSSSSSSDSSLANSSAPSSNTRCTDPAVLEANVSLLFRVVRSKRFEGLVVGLLRFITGCPSILDRSMRIKVEFVVGMSTATVPTAHTCFQTLYLSAAAYESEEQLARLLEICAHNSTSFGQK